MLEPTKTPPTETVMEFSVSCPATAYPAVLDFLRKSGCTIEDDNLEVPASSPGSHLRGLRYREDLTQAQLAELVGIPRHHISEMENDKRPIGKKNARKLADMFKTDPRMFLSA